LNPPTPLRVLLAAIGTRGDLQPMLALGQTLQRRGHRVRVAAPPNFAGWVASWGFDFSPVGVDMHRFLLDHPALLTGNTRKAAPVQSDFFANQIPQQMQDLMAACADADALVWAGLAVVAPSVAERLNIPALGVLYTPCVIPSAAHPPPTVSKQNLPRWVNRILWNVHDIFAARALGRPLNQARIRLGLSPVNLRDHLMNQCEYVLAADEAVFPGSPEWDVRLQRTHSLFLEDPQALDAELESWLQAGDPPIFVGFGSMTGEGTQRIDRLLLSALEAGGHRVLVGSGWAGMGQKALPPHWRMLDSAPHDKLFPRMAVVVHHGGAGTTATALRAGVPQVVVPLILDQYYHAHRLHLAGLAPPPVAMERISARQLSEAVTAALALPEGPRLQAAQRLQTGDAAAQIALRLEGLQRPPNPAVS